MLAITDKAAVKIKEISEAEGIGHFNIRLKVIGGGCAGMTHDLFFEEVISDLDEVSDIDGIKIIIDPISFQYLENANIDYIENSMSAGFKITNPDIKSTCGCGSSFAY